MNWLLSILTLVALGCHEHQSNTSNTEAVLPVIDTSLGRTRITVSIQKDSMITVRAVREKDAAAYTFIAQGFSDNAGLMRKGLILEEGEMYKFTDCYLAGDSLLVIALLDFKYRIRPFFFNIQLSNSMITPVCTEGWPDCHNYIDGEMGLVLLDTTRNILYTHSGENFKPGDDSGYRTIYTFRLSKDRITMIGEKDINSIALSSDSDYLRFYQSIR